MAWVRNFEGRACNVDERVIAARPDDRHFKARCGRVVNLHSGSSLGLRMCQKCCDHKNAEREAIDKWAAENMDKGES